MATEEAQMERHLVEEAIQQLQQQGVPLGKITLPQVRECLGSGSYRDIRTHLQAIRAEAGQVEDAGDQKSGSENQRPNTAARTAPDQQDPLEIAEDPDPADDPPSDPLAEAEEALAHAQAQVLEAEAQLPLLEHALEEAKTHLVTAVGQDEDVRVTVRRGLLPPQDPLVVQRAATVTAAERAVKEAAWQLDQARQRQVNWQQRVHEAGQRRTQALQQVWVQTHHPELWQALQQAREARAEDPLLQDPRVPFNAFQASVRKFDRAVVGAVSYHQQRIEALEAQVAAVLQDAGI
jgi:hypothetical protein